MAAGRGRVDGVLQGNLLPQPVPHTVTGPDWLLHPGRYQTPDGLWHAARFSAWQHDRVVLSDEGDALRQVIGPEALRRFVRDDQPDTITSVRDFVLPGHHRVEAPVFARQLLRGRGLALYRYSRLENRSLFQQLVFPHEGDVLLLLRQGPVLALPRSRRRLQALLLSALADNSASVASLRARPPRLWREVEPLLRGYIARQPLGSAAHQ